MNMVTFVMADHGMRYGMFSREINSIQEHRLPAMFMIANKSLLDQIEYSYDTLHHNTRRLTTGVDIRKTIMWLGNW